MQNCYASAGLQTFSLTWGRRSFLRAFKAKNEGPASLSCYDYLSLPFARSLVRCCWSQPFCLCILHEYYQANLPGVRGVLPDLFVLTVSCTSDVRDLVPQKMFPRLYLYTGCSFQFHSEQHYCFQF